MRLLLCDVSLMAALAAAGILTAALPLTVIGLLIVTTLIFTVAMDSIKLAAFARLRID